MNKLITSSSDPKKLSLTIKGILVAIVPIVAVLLGLPEADLQPLINGIVDVVYAGSALISAVMVVYGAGRKVYNQRWSASE